jgi:hypothetical protein
MQLKYAFLKRFFLLFWIVCFSFLLSCKKDTTSTQSNLDKPEVSTLSATSITSNSATLNGSVNPNGSQTDAWFEYGTSPTLTGYTACPNQTIGSDKNSLNISQPVTNLSPKMTYYYRIVASSDLGITNGTIMDFNTSAASYANLTGEWILTTTSFSNDNYTGSLSANVNLTQTNGLLEGYTQDVYKIIGTFTDLVWLIQRKSDFTNYLSPHGSGNIINAGVNITIQSHNLEFDLASSNFHFRGVSPLYDNMTGDLTVKMDMTALYGLSDGIITLTGTWEANRK